MFKILTALTVLAVATAETLEERPQVESPTVMKNNFPNRGWELSDWFVGLTMGVYGPLAAYARDDDCFSAWYLWGTAAIEYNKYFDRKFNTKKWQDWFGLIIQTTIITFKTMAVPTKCKEELDYAKETEWHNNFGFMADVSIPEVPRVMEYSYTRDNTSFTVWQIVGLILSAMSVYGYWISEFWFWGLGFSMGGLFSTIFIAVDVWSGAHVITPMPARIRYLDN